MCLHADEKNLEEELQKRGGITEAVSLSMRGDGIWCTGGWRWSLLGAQIIHPL